MRVLYSIFKVVDTLIEECIIVEVPFIWFLYLYIVLDSSMVEHAAVNRGVVGSSPTRGVF